MAALAQVSQLSAGVRRPAAAARGLGAPLRAAAVRRGSVRAMASASKPEMAAPSKVVSLGAVASTWMMAGNAQAATELSQLAAGDGRLATISLLFLPALGWVGFNMLQPFGNQLSRMNEMAEDASAAGGKKRRGLAAGVGLGAALALAAAQSADAATELSQVAAGDSRLGTISLLFLPALGWVAFNILQPFLNQLGRMSEMNEDAAPPSGGKKKRGVAAGVGLGAALSLAAAQSADAATELSQLAASDSRLATISLLFLPALGWVGFNMLQPFGNQLSRMNEMAEDASAATAGGGKKRRGLAAGVGLGAALSLAAAQSADAATELSQVAAGDSRLATISLLFLPAIGWVAFNILQPFLNQLGRMSEMNEDASSAPTKKKR